MLPDIGGDIGAGGVAPASGVGGVAGGVVLELSCVVLVGPGGVAVGVVAGGVGVSATCAKATGAAAASMAATALARAKRCKLFRVDMEAPFYKDRSSVTNNSGLEVIRLSSELLYLELGKNKTLRRLHNQ